MIKIFFIFFFFLVLNNCSFNSKNIIQNDDKKVDSIGIEYKQYEKIKEEIIQYGKNKDFPDINN